MLRIEVVVERRAFESDIPGCPMIRTRVIVDEKDEFALTRALNDAELKSNFDIVWEYMGRKIKKGIEAKLKDK